MSFYFSKIEIHTVRNLHLALVPTFFAYSKSPINPRLSLVSGSVYRYRFPGLMSRWIHPALPMTRRATQWLDSPLSLKLKL